MPCATVQSNICSWCVKCDVASNGIGCNLFSIDRVLFSLIIFTVIVWLSHMFKEWTESNHETDTNKYIITIYSMLKSTILVGIECAIFFFVLAFLACSPWPQHHKNCTRTNRQRKSARARERGTGQIGRRYSFVFNLILFLLHLLLRQCLSLFYHFVSYLRC